MEMAVMTVACPSSVKSPSTASQDTSYKIWMETDAMITVSPLDVLNFRLHHVPKVKFLRIPMATDVWMDAKMNRYIAKPIQAVTTAITKFQAPMNVCREMQTAIAAIYAVIQSGAQAMDDFVASR